MCGGYFYRLFVGLFAQWHLLRFITRVQRYMLEADPAAVKQHGGEAGRRERRRRASRATRRGLLPSVLRTYLPGYIPHDIEFTEEMRMMAQAYTERAKSSF